MILWQAHSNKRSFPLVTSNGPSPHDQRAHGQAQAIQRVADPRVRTLLPLLKELELQRRHDLRALREEVEECARALERHKVNNKHTDTEAPSALLCPPGSGHLSPAFARTHARTHARTQEMFTWSACTHAAHAEQVQTLMPHLAHAARRMCVQCVYLCART